MSKKLKSLFSIAMLLLITGVTHGQSGTINKSKYRIVIQLTSGDTTVHRNTISQINHALAEAPYSKIELVCHNTGISILQLSKTIVAQDIQDLKNRGVVFAACANTIRLRKIDKADIVPQAIIVPAGIIEVVDKQSKGWAYIKAGN
jgi:intracellular sulfur oxidation DsrE/DsrF family protein